MCRCSTAMFAAVVTLGALLPMIHGHSLFKCPAPRDTSDTLLKTYPCGSGAANTNWGGEFTTIAPGPLTVVIEETIDHEGAPMRIALSINNDDSFEDYVLLDHIPHWDNGPALPRYYFINVEIPDVDCSNINCALQIISVMTDKLPNNPGYCDNLINSGDEDFCFSVYHSCANVHITGSTPPSAYTHTYTAPDGFADPSPNRWSKGESGKWSASWFEAQDAVWYQEDICGEYKDLAGASSLGALSVVSVLTLVAAAFLTLI